MKDFRFKARREKSRENTLDSLDGLILGTNHLASQDTALDALTQW